MKKLLIFLLLTNSAFAQNAAKLDKGQKAPFKGVLLTESKVIELDKAQRSNLVLEDLRIHQKGLIEFHKQDARVQRRKVSEAKFRSYLTNIGMFTLGAVLTGFTFKVNQKIGGM